MNRIPVYCAGCRERLDYTADTNGDGEVLLYVRGCLRCTRLVQSIRHRVVPVNGAEPATVVMQAPPKRARGGNKHRPQRNGAGELVCIVCGVVLDWSRKGRAPVFCAQHRDPKKRTA